MSSRYRWKKSHATAPVSPLRTLPGVAQKRSQTLSPRPSSFAAPSIWYDAVAAPQMKSRGNVPLDMGFLSNCWGWGIHMTSGGLLPPCLDEGRRDFRADVDGDRTAVHETA